ncbi:hypothetical protein SAMN05421846_11332 [Chryseobacterium taeanense]|uniref:Uncharacterized protein n=1 Tax=Chryseobacterium taeanense TaxID=311334 RepID=A0A1G8N805_9FLAO|nr:hypothetical protein [Chryseobacterium taeanense]SDI76338.1 hypothetical protein SAMN05421846_11332 [Chryseobacterium taeanense]
MKNLIILIKDPFKVIKEDKSDFLIWLIFTIITGQLGIFANFIVRHYTNNTSLKNSIYIESTNGSFYTFSIALIASLLGPIFINFIKSDKIQFRTLKTFTIIIAIFYLFIAGIVYTSIQSKNKTVILSKNIESDFSQLIIYIFAIIFASYGYCILKLESSTLNFSNINDPLFSEQNNENVESLLNSEQSLNQDPNGIEL